MKLAVLDKDGTLTTPISGAKFPQSPTDQQLLPGVKEAIDRLRADGWSLAIASNQGGCDVFTVQASQVRVGNYIVHGKDDRYQVIGIDVMSDGGIVLRHNRERPNSKEYSFAFPDSNVRLAYKTIDSAIEECQFAADLCGIDVAMFCPDMAGQRCIDMMKTLDAVYGHPETSDRIWKMGEITCDEIFTENYRKPGPGMLSWSNIPTQLGDWTDRIMIGDRPEDEAAALAAGFRFMDAQEWRDGGPDSNKLWSQS